MKKYTLNLYVIDNGEPPLLGREWIEPLKINFNIEHNINLIKNGIYSNNTLITSFPEFFTNKLGTYMKSKCKLILKDNLKAIFFKPRTLLYKIRDQVELELDRYKEY